VSGWIVATANHTCAEGDELDKKLFMDFDMAILAAPPARYAQYADAIWREHAHFGTVLFCLGRSRFLRAFVSSDAPIYATEPFRAQGEADARRNAASELPRLRRRLLLRISLWLLLGALLLILGVRCGAVGRCVAWLGCAACAGWHLFTRYQEWPYAVPAARDTRTVLFAGSLNPPHLGHLSIIRHLAASHESVHVVIGHNARKVTSPYSPSP
jgi:hypothetical protein